MMWKTSCPLIASLPSNERRRRAYAARDMHSDAAEDEAVPVAAASGEQFAPRAPPRGGLRAVEERSHHLGRDCVGGRVKAAAVVESSGGSRDLVRLLGHLCRERPPKKVVVALARRVDRVPIAAAEGAGGGRQEWVAARWAAVRWGCARR